MKVTFFTKQTEKQKNYYISMLEASGSLSRLFSESKEPYLYYRLAENIFCKSFSARNLSRADVSVDAVVNNIGIGLKTYLQGFRPKREKIAEFNSESKRLKHLHGKELAIEISRLRNKRISTAKDIYGLTDTIYHCVTRSEGKMSLHEYPLLPIQIEKLQVTKETESSINFTDGKEQYSYNYSKSTLFKKFDPDPIIEIPVNIDPEPFSILEKISKKLQDVEPDWIPTVYLPLYSTRGTGPKTVPEKSGLNQWNAKGRKRHPDEVYIPVPATIKNYFPGFFPDRSTVFNLILPDNQVLHASMCQGGDKAIMSNPNNTLGEWLLRGILKIPTGELVTYSKLSEIGLDTVVVKKISETTYSIDFAKTGSYEHFANKIKSSN